MHKGTAWEAFRVPPIVIGGVCARARVCVCARACVLLYWVRVAWAVWPIPCMSLMCCVSATAMVVLLRRCNAMVVLHSTRVRSQKQTVNPDFPAEGFMKTANLLPINSDVALDFDLGDIAVVNAATGGNSTRSSAVDEGGVAVVVAETVVARQNSGEAPDLERGRCVGVYDAWLLSGCLVAA